MPRADNSSRSWLPGSIAVPYWVVSLILLGLIFAVFVGALVFIPSAQRPTLVPASSASITATPTPSGS